MYLIAEIETIADATALKEYGTKVAETLAPFNGHYRPEQAHAWYGSPAYEAIRPIVQAATKGRVFIVEGLGQ